MPHAPVAPDRSTNDRLLCLSLSVVTSVMIAVPATPGEAPDTWWLALSLGAFTLGCVFASRALIVGATIGAAVPVAQFILTTMQSGMPASPALDSHAIALFPALASAFAGATLRRTLVPIPVPVRR